MYLVIEIEFKSSKDYIYKSINSLIKKHDMDISATIKDHKIILIADENADKLEWFLNNLEHNIPASIYLGKTTHKLLEEIPKISTLTNELLPIDLSLCPSCQKEMFDVSSRRYYYPFTSCNSCGSQHTFLEKYPYTRKNSSMKFLNPCKNCQDEMKKNPLRLNYPLISCIECGINLKMKDKKSQRYANDKGSFKQLFEVSAKAIDSDKSVVFKTPFGYRKFEKASRENISNNSILFFTNASTLNTHLMMVPQEFNALLSIERPLIRIATKSTKLKELFGSSCWCKYPDDGMSMLLAKELVNLGLDFVVYRECDEDESCDYFVDFDIPINPQKDIRVFINQDTKLIISGERTIFPSQFDASNKTRVTIANRLLSLDGIIDKRERFQKILASEVYIKKDEPLEFDGAFRFDGFKASMLSVLGEHQKLDQKAVGVHFDDRLHFLYYNQKEVIDVVPPKPFEASNLFEKISTLRDGSDRLVENFKKSFPSLFKRVDSLDGEYNLFEVVAILLEIEDESFDGISSKALEFMGKGGVAIDTKVADNRFDDYAFLASLMSFKLTNAQTSLLCYSIYESFGDYIADIVNQLIVKTKATTLTLSGKSFANQALWGRIKRNLSHKNPILNIEYPIGDESMVYGANYL